MLTVENVWDIVRKFDGVSIPFNPSIETGGIFEIILPTTVHKRQCCVYIPVKAVDEIPKADERIMRDISENRYMICTGEELEAVLRKL